MSPGQSPDCAQVQSGEVPAHLELKKDYHPGLEGQNPKILGCGCPELLSPSPFQLGIAQSLDQVSFWERSGKNLLPLLLQVHISS